MSVLSKFISLAAGPIQIGQMFDVEYEVTGAPAGQIAVSCEPPYSAGPDIPVTGNQGTAKIAIQGPAGAATVAVTGELVTVRLFPQDVT